jgi:hypothetical protein
MYVSAGVWGVATALSVVEPRVQCHYFPDAPCSCEYTWKLISEPLSVRIPTGYNYISFAMSKVAIIWPVLLWSYTVLVLYVVTDCSEKNTACIICAVGRGNGFILAPIPTYLTTLYLLYNYSLNTCGTPSLTGFCYEGSNIFGPTVTSNCF